MAPVPIALCGKHAPMSKNFTKLMSPEYEVTHVFNAVEQATNELPPLLRGENIKPASGIGSNADSSESIVPYAIVCGAGFTSAEVEEMRKLDGAQNVPWLLPDPSRIAEARKYELFSQEFMEFVVGRAKACLKEHGLTGGMESSSKPDVWSY